MNDGFILIHRKIVKEWEWYNNVNDRLVWFHCLLSANWCDGWYNGKLIPRGSFVTGRKKLSTEIGLTEQQVRTSLEHLKSTNNITIKSFNKYSVITINNYNKYQLPTNNITNNQPTSNQQVTNNQPTSNHNIINNNEEQLITIKNNEDKIYNNVDYETEFEELWKLYPKKQGKKDALKSYVKARKKGIDKETILNGLNNYVNYIKFKNIDDQFVKMGSSWFNQESWNDTYDLQKTIKSERKNIFQELLEEEQNEKERNIIDVEYIEKSVS